MITKEEIVQSFDRLWAQILAKFDDTNKENAKVYATLKYVNDNLCKIDKILVNGVVQTIGAAKDVNIDLSDYPTFADMLRDSGKIDVILLNGAELPISPDKKVNIILPGSTESNENTVVYITGVKDDSDESYYNKAVNVNLATGTITAPVISADKVYGPVWNDYAEWFEKENNDEEFMPGDICAWYKTGVIKAVKNDKSPIVGVYSDTYGHILGGEKIENMEDNLKNYVPVGLVGRVKVNILGQANIGDYIVASNIPGVGEVDNTADLKLVIGQALETKDSYTIERATILIK